MHDAFTKSPLFAIMISVHPLGHTDNDNNIAAVVSAAAAAVVLSYLPSIHIQFQRPFK